VGFSFASADKGDFGDELLPGGLAVIAEPGTKVESVFGVAVKSEKSLECVPSLGTGMASWGCGKCTGEGEAGCDEGGDGGKGVIGECQDCTLWKESVDSTGELSAIAWDCGVGEGASSLASGLSLDLEGGEVTRVSWGGAVNERPAIMRFILFLVKLTGAT
jgi:hypothetical protein